MIPLWRIIHPSHITLCPPQPLVGLFRCITPMAPMANAPNPSQVQSHAILIFSTGMNSTMMHDHSGSGSDEEGNQHSTHNQSTAAHSAHLSMRHSHHFACHSNNHSGHKSNQHPLHQPPHVPVRLHIYKVHSTETPTSFIRLRTAKPKQLRLTPFKCHTIRA